MSNTQLRDNLCYLVAMEKFTAEEFELMKKELERRLRPSVYTAA